MRKVIPFLATALVVAAMLWQATTPETTLMPTPELAFPELAGATWEELPMSESEKNILPADTVLMRRRYSFADGHFLQLTAVVGGRSKSSVHRPELCLPGQGFLMKNPRTVSSGSVSWRMLDLEHAGDGRMGFAYTFANGQGLKTSSHLVRIFTDVWNRSVHGRIDRWVMLTVSASITDEARLRAILEKLEGVVK